MTHVPLMLWFVHAHSITGLAYDILIILLLHLPEHLCLVEILHRLHWSGLGVFVFDVRRN